MSGILPEGTNSIVPCAQLLVYSFNGEASCLDGFTSVLCRTIKSVDYALLFWFSGNVLFGLRG
jgi:hypothetical protein